MITCQRLMSLWKFSTKLTEEDEICCPECQTWIPITEWQESYVGCEFCGEHTALQCPRCNECFDHVWSPVFTVRRHGIVICDIKGN